MAKVSAVIVAAGRSTRMGDIGSKPYIKIDGRPVLSYSLTAFEMSPLIAEILVVVDQKEIEKCRQEVIEPYGFRKVTKIVPGGAIRQESVWRGLQQVSPDTDYVAVHDGARPLLTTSLLEKIVRCAEACGAAVAAVPVKDTIKVAGKDDYIADTPDRKKLWAVQTPQVFRLDQIVSAYRKAIGAGFTGTDDAMILEFSQIPVKLCPGSYENIKITTPEDLELAEMLLRRRNKCGLA